ncbi:MAG: ABC transporter substrate-binding protein [Anaerolineales bacterium]|nr:ABC transporter substrate-binding protein [Anaerolineales bacterium]
MSHSKRALLFAAFFLLMIACGIFPSSSSVTPAASETPAAPISTSAPESRALTICIGQEPPTLYPFGELSDSARSVLAAVYDDPYDVVGYKYQTGILAQVPSIENGDAQITPVEVKTGDEVVDADGNLIKLTQGAKIRPSGCRADDCAIAYDGVTPLKVDQMTVNFRMRNDLTWSDGTPITADDSVYAYTLASAPNANPVNAYIAKYTQTYEAADATTAQWWGKPGFFDSSYAANFFAPAPKHVWSKFTVAQMPEIDMASRSPMGWGAYMIQEWAKGDHIALTKNPYYYRAAEGLPKFDRLVFRFISDPNIALTELVARRCDILDPSIRLDSHVGLLQQMQAGEQAQAFFTPGMTIEWLGLGVTPSSYADGYNVDFQIDRQDIFGDAHTRQAIVYCLDRQSVVDNLLFGLTAVPATYIPVAHPLYDPNTQKIQYDPTIGNSLLDQAGWRDADGDPSTPRIAVTVKNVIPGTPLKLNYYTTISTQRRQVAEILTLSLQKCGVEAVPQYFSQNDLYSSGPIGLLFGRKFDLAEYSMGVNDIQPPCEWFTSQEVPADENSWIGTNLSGYKNEEYDAVCRTAKSALPDEKNYAESYRQTQVIFADELPSIPLFYRLRVAAARPDLCGFDLDPTANPLWNIEAFDVGEACQK